MTLLECVRSQKLELHCENRCSIDDEAVINRVGITPRTTGRGRNQGSAWKGVALEVITLLVAAMPIVVSVMGVPDSHLDNAGGAPLWPRG